MASMLKGLVLCCLATLAVSHHCLLSPPQRTPLVGINKMMAPACLQTTPPCGNTTASKPSIYFRAGATTEIVFEKNMAHYDAANPGYYSISIGEEGKTLSELRRFTDTPDTAIFIYSLNVTIPADLDRSKSYILQVKHVTNSARRPFLYQCADVGIVGTSNVVPIGK